MLQPEALSQASSLTAAPLRLGNCGNRGVNSKHKCTQRKISGNLSLYVLNLYFESCGGSAMCAQELFVRMQGVEMFNKT